MHYHARVRAVFLVVALLGLLPRALPALAPGDDWHFVPPDPRPALLLETRKPQAGAAAERSHATDGPRGTASPAAGAPLPGAVAAFLPGDPLPLRPQATGPPA